MKLAGRRDPLREKTRPCPLSLSPSYEVFHLLLPRAEKPLEVSFLRVQISPHSRAIKQQVRLAEEEEREEEAHFLADFVGHPR